MLKNKSRPKAGCHSRNPFTGGTNPCLPILTRTRGKHLLTKVRLCTKIVIWTQRSIGQCGLTAVVLCGLPHVAERAQSGRQQSGSPSPVQHAANGAKQVPPVRATRSLHNPRSQTLHLHTMCRSRFRALPGRSGCNVVQISVVSFDVNSRFHIVLEHRNYLYLDHHVFVDQIGHRDACRGWAGCSVGIGADQQVFV